MPGYASLLGPAFPHAPTLALSTVVVAIILGALLLCTWLQDRSHRALLWWSPAFFLIAAGATMLTLRGVISDWQSIAVANAAIILAAGLVWGGARRFGGRSTRLWWIAVPPLGWTLSSQLPLLASDINLRIAVISLTLAAYFALAAGEFWRGRAERLVSRWPAIVLLGLQATTTVVRVPIIFASHLPADDTLFRSGWFGALALGTLFYTTATAFLLLAMTKERSELRYRKAAQTDPLTGLLNRGAFFAEANVRLQSSGGGDRAAALAFDLDRFKQINDSHGHARGDRVLRLFAEVVREQLRSTDVVGRIGGEEFAALMLDCDPREAFSVAERIRAEFAHATAAHIGLSVDATVSVGVATLHPNEDLARLLAEADRATYRAKADGRNCVRGADGRLPGVTDKATADPMAA